MITFYPFTTGEVAVRRDGKTIGWIDRKQDGTWFVDLLGPRGWELVAVDLPDAEAGEVVVRVWLAGEKDD